MLTATFETLNFGFSLFALLALYTMVVTITASPIVVIGWICGFGREIFSDTSDQARFARAVYIVTTAIVIAIITWLVGVF